MKNEKIPEILNITANENQSIHINRKSTNEIIITIIRRVASAFKIVK